MEQLLKQKKANYALNRIKLVGITYSNKINDKSIISIENTIFDKVCHMVGDTETFIVIYSMLSG